MLLTRISWITSARIPYRRQARFFIDPKNLQIRYALHCSPSYRQQKNIIADSLSFPREDEHDYFPLYLRSDFINIANRFLQMFHLGETDQNVKTFLWNTLKSVEIRMSVRNHQTALCTPILTNNHSTQKNVTCGVVVYATRHLDADG